MTSLASGFLWGAASAAHQVEGNNVNSDWWAREGTMPGMERSGDAVDSYHRYEEEMSLLAEAGLNAYRFSIEWARIEPVPGHISRAELAHYRRMIDTARRLGLTPVITMHHFTTPRWFAEEGGWRGDKAIDRFTSYGAAAAEILGDVEWVCTINEPNILSIMVTMMRGSAWQSPTVEGDSPAPEQITRNLPLPDPVIGRRLVEAHQAMRSVLKERTDAAVGWTVANGALTARPGAEEKLREVRYVSEDLYLEASRADDFVGVQSYSSQEVDENGLVPHPPHPDNTLVGTAYRPDALAMAVRHSAEVAGVPVLVTENGIATGDDERRIAYTSEALRGLFAAIDDGVDVRGYLHWSALDNYEWGHWKPTFGLIAVDRETFERQPKPSLGWLGRVARRGTL
jgi:beta-glucosidase